MRTLAFASLVGLTLTLAACKPAEPPPPVPTPELQKPRAPSMLTATPGAGFVRLVWRDESDTEEGFIIGRVALTSPQASFDAAALVELTRVTADQVVFRDTPQLAQVWGYGVAAFNAAGVSDFVLLPAGVAAFGATGAGCEVAVPSAEDPDGDGLSSETELAGWTVRLNLNGAMQFSDVPVTSQATLGDADDDGLCDAEELILRTNPNLADTDGDGLDDDDEVLIYGSSPINVDSDGDSTGNSAFFDGSELSRFGTSPTLADTDGDGRTDFEEINQNSTNALVADLPQPKLELVGTVDVSVNLQLTSGSMTTSTQTTSMTRGMETSTDRTSGVVSSTTSEMSVEASAGVSAGFPDGVGVSASVTYGQSETRMSETSTSFAQSSTSTAREAYERATTREATQGEVITDGTLAVQFNVTNQGTRTFELRDLVVTALTRDPRDPSRLASVATLTLPAAASQVTLGEGQSAGPFRVEATIPANVALDLLSNPSGLVFKPASFQLVDRTGTNFAFTVGETTANRTAQVVIDYGGDRPLETYRVATNVARVDGGQLKGVPLTQALAAVGLMNGPGWQALPTPSGVRRLTRVRDVEVQRRGTGTGKFWAVIAAENTSSRVPASTRLLEPTRNFEDLVLMPRDRVYLAYVADEDGDGLFSREERLYRTSDTLADTDGDGLSDRVEIREGWNVFSTLPVYATRPKVYPDPTRTDADSDSLDDSQERTRGTDPNRSDTDGDGLRDDVDPDPLRGVSRPLLAGYGTLGGMNPLAIVVDDVGRMTVLGQGGVDVDGDGVLTNTFNRSVFLVGFGADGQKRWAHELELLDPTTTMETLVKGPDGHVFFFENLYAGAFPGVGNGFQLVELDADGQVVSVVPVNGGGGGFRPKALQRTTRGDFVTMGNGPYNSTAGGFPLRVLVFSATGATVGFREFAPQRFINDPPQPRSDLFAASNAGVMLLLRNCEVLVFDRTLAPLPGRNVCTEFPTVIDTMVATDTGALYVARAATTVKYEANGIIGWSNSATHAAFTNSMVVDRAGRVFRSTQENVGSTTFFYVKVIDAMGNETAESTLPTPIYAGPADVDANGNYVLLGQMYDGLNGRLVQLGSYDLVMMRNPQLIFP